LPLPWQPGAVFKSTNGGGSWSAVITGLYDVFVLAIDPLTPTTLYIGDGGNAYKSINGGGSWSAIGIGWSTFTLAIDPQTPTTLYMGTSIGLFKSTNGGGAWNGILGHYSRVSDVAIDPLMPTTLYAGGVVKSTNGGGSWSDMSTGLPNRYVFTLAIDPQNPATLYVGTDGAGVFVLQWRQFARSSLHV